MSYIDPRKAFNYFSSNYQLRQSTNGWYLFNCPFCEGQFTRGVQFSYGLTKCFKCSFRGSIIDYVAEIEDKTYNEARELLWMIEPARIVLDSLADELNNEPKLKNVKITLPDGFKSILDGTDAMAIRARRYLTKRGFDLEELDHDGFGYCTKSHEEFTKNFLGYIIIPFKRQGKLVYYIGRSFVGHDEMRYKNPPTDYVGIGKSDVIFNESALHLYKTVFISEGWSDAKTMGKNGTATLGWNMSNTQKGFYINSSVKRLVFLPDAGIETGTGLTFYQKATQVATEFMDLGKEVYVVNPNVPELAILGKDANEIGRDAMMKQYKATPRLTWETAMKILTTKNKK